MQPHHDLGPHHENSLGVGMSLFADDEKACAKRSLVHLLY